MLLSLFIAKKGEELRTELRERYRGHRVMSYMRMRQSLYNDVDCVNGELFRLYTSSYNMKCHSSKNIISVDIANAEHIIPQSFFNREEPYVSDLHHIYSAGENENQVRSNYGFGEFPYERCKNWYVNGTSQRSVKENMDEWNCLSSYHRLWMPMKRDRGVIARAFLYFQTMYPEVNISTINNVTLFLKWNKEYPPTKRELIRNDIVNITQGNRNPYIDNYVLADRAFA